MLDWIFIVLAVALGGAGSETTTAETVVVAEPMEQDNAGVTEFTAEPQTPTGKFTTATEIKQILEMTKPNWVAISAQPGNDFLYVTQIWSWRCGLLQMRVSLNKGPIEVWPLPPCHEETNAPNAIIETDGLPFKMFAPGEIESMEVELLLDDLSTLSASYQRSEILMP